MERFNAACNLISHIAFEFKTFGKVALQRLCYYQIRDEFKLSSQMVIRAVAKVCESYSDKKKRDKVHIFKPHGAIVYDDRILTVKSIDTVSVLTLGGRISAPMSVCEYHARILNNALKVRGQTDLGYIDGKFYLFLVAECADEPQNTSEGFLGVDLGIAKIATTSDGKFYSGTKVKNVRRRYFRLRQKLQAKGTKSAKRLLKRRRRKESRHVDKKSRRDQEHFVCTACGHALNADINAALNIARRGAEVIQPNAVA